MKKTILFLLFTSFILYAQEKKSILELERDYYSKRANSIELTTVPIKHPQYNLSVINNLNHSVFGFLPSWTYSQSTVKNIRYNLLTHIAISFFESDGDGNITVPQIWPWNDLIDSTKANNVKLIMVVSNFTGEQIHKLITAQTSQQNLFNNILAKINQYGFNGVNIDFENLQSGDEGTLINGFMKSMTTRFKMINTPLEISFDSPIVNFNGWDFKGLADACDYLFVMGYDFYGSWSGATGPSSPVTGGYYNLTKSLSEDYKNVPAEKIILGVPYYGNYWKTNSKVPYSMVSPFDSLKLNNNWVATLQYNEIISQYVSKEKMWDDVSRTPWLRWGQDTSWNQIWYDDENSLALKYDLAISENLKGVGIWALGYDNGRTELWNLIERKFAQPTNVELSNLDTPKNFELHQNYPNPFNPATTIRYGLPEDGYVKIIVYNILGSEVARLINGMQNAGYHEVNFSASTLGSGIYFYKFDCNGYSEIKKMLLVK